ncbi:MAG: hypothetical protein WCO56_15175 [Verrucomicrobiota bacterium]
MNPFFHILSHFSVQLGFTEKPYGIALVWACPKCRKKQSFQLIQRDAAFKILGVKIERPHTMFDLRCLGCSYDFSASTSEQFYLEQIMSLTALLEEGKLGYESYQKELRSIPARFLKDFLALTDVWKCSACGEENPIGFGSCWNCRRQNENSTTAIDNDEKRFPTGLTGGNPWE